MAMPHIEKIRPLAGGLVRVIVETPRGSRGKFTWNSELGLFQLTGVLAQGMNFPHAFGFVPSTKGGDGDPLDVLVLCDVGVPAGCLLETRLIGTILAEQSEDGKTERNDRFIAVEVNSPGWLQVANLSELPEIFLAQLEHFFVSYNEIKGKAFKPLGREDSHEALNRLKRSLLHESRFHKRGGASGR